jgi:ABC-2 type transport system permease protein
MSAAAEPVERVIGSRPSTRARLGDLWSYRELLLGMVRRDLKVRYKNSVLGFAWSLLNPLMYLAIFYVAFDLILGSSIPSFPVFLLCGLLVWNLYATGLSGATSSIVANAGLVNKVAFPREILPLAAIGAAFVHFLLQFAVFAVVLAAIRWDVAWPWLPLLLPATLVLLVFTAGAGLLLSAVNVHLRDTAHFLELALLAWFWVTPIVYGFMVVGRLDDAKTVLFMLNPLTPIVLVFQRAIYNTLTFGGEPVEGAGGALSRLSEATEVLPSWSMGGYALYLGAVGFVALLILAIGYWAFGRLEADFAEEL